MDSGRQRGSERGREEGEREAERRERGREEGEREGESETKGGGEICIRKVLSEEERGCSDNSGQWLTLSGDSLSDLFVLEKSLPAYCLFIF
jgi:hypothetical protein